MNDVKYGWKCPQCNTLWSAYQEKCPTCSARMTSGLGSMSSAVGTVAIGPTYGVPFTSGTIWIGGTFATKSEAQRAREIVQESRDKGISPKALIIAATDALIKDARDDDEGDDDDD